MKFQESPLLDNPYPHYERWREELPIWWAEDLGGWVISRYEDVRMVLKDHTTFSSDSKGQRKQQSISLPLLSDDQPRHTALRAIVNKAFTSSTLKAMEEDVAQLVDELLNNMSGKTKVDISAEFTIPLPVFIIARLMGIPEERADDFKRWSDAVTATGEARELEDRLPDIQELAAYFASLIPERRANPGPDLFSKIVQAEVDGQNLSDEDIVGFNILLLIAGNETTTNLLSNLLHHLADHPEQWDELCADPDKIDAAIEEILRFDAPVQWVHRRVTTDTEIQGQTIKANEFVYIVLGSANRDTDHYSDPDIFRLDRGRSDHHTFGHGIHFCIGAPLGRMEARIALQGFFNRYARIRHAKNAANERTHSHMLRGFHHLWLELEADAT